MSELKENESVLSFLDSESVVSFTKEKDGTITIEESCDRWVSVNLTKPQFRKLLKELEELLN